MCMSIVFVYIHAYIYRRGGCGACVSATHYFQWFCKRPGPTATCSLSLSLSLPLPPSLSIHIYISLSLSPSLSLSLSQSKV